METIFSRTLAPQTCILVVSKCSPPERGRDMFTAYKIEDANGMQGISYKDREEAWNEFMNAPTPAKLYENHFMLSPRGDFVKVGSELLFSRK